MTNDEHMLECWRDAREAALVQLWALESGRLRAIARGSDISERQIATLHQIVANYDMLISLVGASIIPAPKSGPDFLSTSSMITPALMAR